MTICLLLPHLYFFVKNNIKKKCYNAPSSFWTLVSKTNGIFWHFLYVLIITFFSRTNDHNNHPLNAGCDCGREHYSTLSGVLRPLAGAQVYLVLQRAAHSLWQPWRILWKSRRSKSKAIVKCLKTHSFLFWWHSTIAFILKLIGVA